MKRPYTSSDREELDIELQVLEGQVPHDLHGHVFIQSPCGTVNNAFPIPPLLPDGKYNQEYGSPVFNGDGKMLRFDLESGQVKLKSRILRTPCFYADEATKRGTPWHKNKWGFMALGIARTSLKLGSRNQVNTGVTAFRFKNDQKFRISANFDMGRPYEFDPSSLQLITPIGRNDEWAIGVPKFLNYPFPLVQTTAHPTIDAKTGEFFTVNFTKTMQTMFFSKGTLEALEGSESEVEAALEKLVDEIKVNPSQKERLIKKTLSILERPQQILNEKKNILQRSWNWIIELIEKIWRTVSGMIDAVYLLRWTGEQDIKRWKVIDQATGKPIKIVQCMHQTGLSEDYIVLIDSSFKFAVDIMLTNPFPANPKIDEFLRQITCKITEPRTTSWVISRKDLRNDQKTVKARQFIIPIETVHFSLNYANPDGKIVMHAAHNTASCAAEWVRPYDKLAIDPTQKIHANTVGLMTCGEMDIGRIGKVLIDAEQGQILDFQQLYNNGFQPDGSIGAHTWAIGLHTYRDIISPELMVEKVENIFWQSYGLDPRMLTDFIKGLYMEYENRIESIDTILANTKKGIPFALVRQNTESMQLEDYHLFAMNQQLRSLQFVPRKEAKEGIEHSLNGYIFCTMVNGEPDMLKDEYSREVWIFDASNLMQGPVCKLSHPKMDWAFTIHSTWIPSIAPADVNYKIDVRSDYSPLIKNIKNPIKKHQVDKLFEEHIYPHFD